MVRRPTLRTRNRPEGAQVAPLSDRIGGVPAANRSVGGPLMRRGRRRRVWWNRNDKLAVVRLLTLLHLVGRPFAVGERLEAMSCRNSERSFLWRLEAAFAILFMVKIPRLALRRAFFRASQGGGLPATPTGQRRG